MKSLSEGITDFYIRNEIIDPQMRDIYQYGTELIINDIIIFSSILILGAVFDTFWHSVIFSSVFYLTRIRCGGFHAKRAWVCKLSMLATYISVTALYYAAVRFDAAYAAFMLNFISVLLVLPVIPVENPNKPLSSEVRQKNRTQGLIIVFLFTVSAGVLISFGIQEGVIISLTVAAVAVLAEAGKVINERGKKLYEKRIEVKDFVNDSRNGS